MCLDSHTFTQKTVRHSHSPQEHCKPVGADVYCAEHEHERRHLTDVDGGQLGRVGVGLGGKAQHAHGQAGDGYGQAVGSGRWAGEGLGV